MREHGDLGDGVGDDRQHERRALAGRRARPGAAPCARRGRRQTSSDPAASVNSLLLAARCCAARTRSAAAPDGTRRNRDDALARCERRTSPDSARPRRPDRAARSSPAPRARRPASRRSGSNARTAPRGRPVAASFGRIRTGNDPPPPLRPSARRHLDPRGVALENEPPLVRRPLLVGDVARPVDRTCDPAVDRLAAGRRRARRSRRPSRSRSRSAPRASAPRGARVERARAPRRPGRPARVRRPARRRAEPRIRARRRAQRADEAQRRRANALGLSRPQTSSAAAPATSGAAMLVPFQLSPRIRCQGGTVLHAAPGASTETPRSPPGSGPRLENAKSRSPGHGVEAAVGAAHRRGRDVGADGEHAARGARATRRSRGAGPRCRRRSSRGGRSARRPRRPRARRPNRRRPLNEGPPNDMLTTFAPRRPAHSSARTIERLVVAEP